MHVLRWAVLLLSIAPSAALRQETSETEQDLVKTSGPLGVQSEHKLLVKTGGPQHPMRIPYSLEVPGEQGTSVGSESEHDFSVYPGAFGGASPEQLERFFAQPMHVGEIWTDHLEKNLFPMDLQSLDKSDVPGQQYTYGWRRDIFARLLTTWGNLAAKMDWKYWIEAGTLVGYARARGIIPWDIDTDVSMLATDFAKLSRDVDELTDSTGMLNVSLSTLPHDVLLYTGRQDIDLSHYPGHPKLHGRNDQTPARLIDLKSGFFIDIFGTVRERQDGNIQAHWDSRWTGAYHECDETRNDANSCEHPCGLGPNCWIWKREVVLPLKPCRMQHVNATLMCPQDPESYLDELYSPPTKPWRKPDKKWNDNTVKFDDI